MATITSARFPRNRALRALLGAVATLALALSIANFADMGMRAGLLVLLLAMAIFVRMAREDAASKLVDLRLAALLGLLLLLASRYAVRDYCFALLAYFLLFRMLCIASGLYAALSDRLAQRLLGARAGILHAEIPFLPCFAAGLLGMAALFQAFPEWALPLGAFTDALADCVTLLPTQARAFILLGLAPAWASLEAGNHFLGKRWATRPGIGMGDVLVLPSFAAFMGGGFFLAALGVAAAISLAVGAWRGLGEAQG